MTNNIYTRGISICLSLIILSSCAGVRHDIEQFFKPKVSENPYRGATPTAHTPRTQTSSTHATKPQSVQQWTPTTRNSTPATTPQPRPQTPTQPIAQPSTPSQKINIAANTPPPSASSNNSSTVTQIATPAAPSGAAVTPANPKPPTQPVVAPPAQPQPAKDIFTVSLVAGKPTHVHHPHNPAKIIRVTNAQGVKYPSGTIMRVPGEDIRFYVP